MSVYAFGMKTKWCLDADGSTLFLLIKPSTTSQQRRCLGLDSLPNQESPQIMQKLKLLSLGQGSDHSLHDSPDSNVLDLENGKISTAVRGDGFSQRTRMSEL